MDSVPASGYRRLIASAIDGVALTGIIVCAVPLGLWWVRNEAVARGESALIIVGISFIYVGLLGRRGLCPGQRVCGIGSRQSADGGQLGVWRSGLRSAPVAIPMLVLFPMGLAAARMGALVVFGLLPLSAMAAVVGIALSPLRRGWHDLLAGSVVVRTG